MTMARVNVSWQNWPGAPGVSTFYLDAAAGSPDLQGIRGFFDNLKTNFPANLTFTFPRVGDTIDENTGLLNGTWDAGVQQLDVVGTGTGGYAGNAGAVVHWLTSGVARGRRVRGRTFLVPLVSLAFDSSGSLAPAQVTSLNTHSQTLIDFKPGALVVWHRPVNGSGGAKFPVVSRRVPDLAISLRSRRV